MATKGRVNKYNNTFQMGAPLAKRSSLTCRLLAAWFCCMDFSPPSVTAGRVVHRVCLFTRLTKPVPVNEPAKEDR